MRETNYDFIQMECRGLGPEIHYISSMRRSSDSNDPESHLGLCGVKPSFTVESLSRKSYFTHSVSFRYYRYIYTVKCTYVFGGATDNLQIN